MPTSFKAEIDEIKCSINISCHVTSCRKSSKIWRWWIAPAPRARWTRLVSTPAIVYDTTQPIRSSRGVSLRTTTQWRYSLQRYRYAFMWPVIANDVIHKTGSTPPGKDRSTAITKRVQKFGEDRASISGDMLSERPTQKQTNTQTRLS